MAPTTPPADPAAAATTASPDTPQKGAHQNSPPLDAVDVSAQIPPHNTSSPIQTGFDLEVEDDVWPYVALGATATMC